MLRENILSWFHNSAQHPGITKTYYTLKEIVYWSSIHKDITYLINHCELCAKAKSNSHKYEQLTPPDISEIPWQRIAIDIVGPLEMEKNKTQETTDLQYKYCLTIIDLCTRWTELIPLQDITAITVSQALDKHWFCRYPRPSYLVSDQGKQFISAEFEEMLKSFGVQHIFTSKYNPQANGICERMHGSLINSIRANQNPNWHEDLPAIQWAINTTYHTQLECSPADLIYNVNMLEPTKRHEGTLKLQTALSSQKKSVIKTNKQLNKSRTNNTFEQDQLVLVKRINPNKTEMKYDGPYHILDVNHKRNYCIIERGTYEESIPFRRLKLHLQKKGRMS